MVEAPLVPEPAEVRRLTNEKVEEISMGRVEILARGVRRWWRRLFIIRVPIRVLERYTDFFVNIPARKYEIQTYLECLSRVFCILVTLASLAFVAFSFSSATVQHQ